MEKQKLEISTICTELTNLARSGTFAQRTVDACTQAAALLETMREIIVLSRADDIDAIAKLKRIMVEQGEG